ncbi:MAG: hypothetical protein M1831_001012 [Alyxoria varia]|nr:MAG: hypothetical protein M1831_001012 [Alyxoria varia]
MAEEKKTPTVTTQPSPTNVDSDTLRQENALGHKQELKRSFGLLSLTSLGIVVANSWAATAGTIVIALFNGGPMSVLYGLIVVGIFYALISASLSELASAIPSAGGVYHWSSVIAGKHGRWVGFFTGYLNACAWLLSASSIASILGNELVAMYLLRNPGVEWQAWHVFIAFQLLNWISCAIVVFGNSLLPLINKISLYLTTAGLIISIICLAALPEKRASNRDVWVNYSNETGGWNDGLCFLIGLLNAAFAVGVPDCISHLAEEVPKPELKVPQGIMLQILTAFATAFIYLIVLFYGINDLGAVFDTTVGYFPTAAIYLQATNGSVPATVGLIAVLFIALFPTLASVFVTGGRMWWSLARDGALPFSSFFAKVSPRLNMPVNATVLMSAIVTVLGCVYVGSTTAFQALISSFIVLSTLSYAGAILPHVLTGRKNIVAGPFYMGNALGFVVNITSLCYIAVTCVFFMFPFVMPAEVESMNYTSVITVGLMTIVAIWWFIGGRKNYRGPVYSMNEAVKIRTLKKGGNVEGDRIGTEVPGPS